MVAQHCNVVFTPIYVIYVNTNVKRYGHQLPGSTLQPFKAVLWLQLCQQQPCSKDSGNKMKQPELMCGRD